MSHDARVRPSHIEPPNALIASAAISDMVLAVAPIILLWNIKISKNAKFLLCGLLSLGFL